MLQQTCAASNLCRLWDILYMNRERRRIIPCHVWFDSDMFKFLWLNNHQAKSSESGSKHLRMPPTKPSLTPFLFLLFSPVLFGCQKSNPKHSMYDIFICIFIPIEIQQIYRQIFPMNIECLEFEECAICTMFVEANERHWSCVPCGFRICQTCAMEIMQGARFEWRDGGWWWNNRGRCVVYIPNWPALGDRPSILWVKSSKI